MAVLLPLIVTVVFGVIVACRSWARRRFRLRVESLGEWRGHSFDEVVTVMAAPRAEAELANGSVIAEWSCDGYRVTAMFDARGHCLGITRADLPMLVPPTRIDAQPAMVREYRTSA
jgi:hypothetical protein